MNPAPETPLADRKRALRSGMRAALAALDPAQRERDSEQLRERILASPEFGHARRVLGFVAQTSEPDLGPLLDRVTTGGGTVLLPRWDAATASYLPAVWSAEHPLATGPFGIPEPPASAPTAAWERLDLILVPGLAFDREGRRLGRGRGFYDRLLAQARNARRWGVGFDLQVVDRVPHEPHDVQLDLIATPGHWLSPASRGRH